MSDRFELFAVQTRSTRAMEWRRYVLHPGLGVLALAETNAFGATGLWGGVAEEALHYVEHGLRDDVSNTPALVKHETALGGAGDPFSPRRLDAALRLANERLFDAQTTESVAVSVTCLVARGASVTVVSAGPDVQVWRVRGGRFETLRASRALSVPTDELSWVGRRATLEPATSVLDVEPGDLVGVGLVHDATIAALTSDAPFDEKLAACFARSLGLSPDCLFLRAAGPVGARAARRSH